MVANRNSIREIVGSHGGKYEDNSVLGYGNMLWTDVSEVCTASIISPDDTGSIHL
jgi:hypothetical protein